MKIVVLIFYSAATVILSIALSSPVILAQDQNSSDALEAFLKKYVELYKKQDYTGVAELMHPLELSEFKTSAVHLMKTADSAEIKYLWPIYYNKYGYDFTPLYEMDSVAFYAEFMKLAMENSSVENISELVANADYEILEKHIDSDTLAGISYNLIIKLPDGEQKSIPDLLIMKKYNNRWTMKFKEDIKKFFKLIEKSRE